MTDPMGYGLWQRLDKTTMWLFIYVRSTPKLEPNCHDWLDSVQCMTKMRQYNDMTDHIGSLYVKNEIELLWSIW